MGLERGECARLVAPGQGGDQQPMLLLREHRPPALLGQAPDHRQLPRQAEPEGQQRGIARDTAKLRVEVAVGQDDQGRVPELCGLAVAGRRRMRA